MYLPTSTNEHFVKSILKGLNSEFPSFTLVAIIQVKSLCTNSWKDNNWIHAFPKGKSSMWNADILVRDLNLGSRVNFLR